MLKKISMSLFVSAILGSGLFANEIVKLSNDIETSLGETTVGSIKAVIAQEAKINPSDIIITNKVEYIPGLYELHFQIKQNPSFTNLIYISEDNSRIIAADVINLLTMSSDTQASFAKVNKGAIEDQAKMKLSATKSVIELATNNTGNSHISLKGSDPKGETLVVFTDPDCPYCKKFETEGALDYMLGGVKEVKIVYFPLTRIHPDAAAKSLWILNQIKERNLTSNEDIQSLMKSVHDKVVSGTPSWKDIDSSSDEFKSFSDNVKIIADSGVVRGTPTVLSMDGETMSLGAIYSQMELDKSITH